MKKLFVTLLLGLLVISCGKDEDQNSNLTGTLIIPAAGVYGGQPMLQHNNQDYYVNVQGEATTQYNQIVNQYMGVQSNSGSHQVPVVFRGTFQQGLMPMNGGQYNVQQAVISYLALGTGGQNIGVLAYGSNCGNSAPLLQANGQQYSIQFSQQVRSFLSTLNPQNAFQQSGCMYLYNVNYMGTPQGSSIVIQSISLR